MQTNFVQVSLVFVIGLSLSAPARAEVTIVRDGAPAADIVVDIRGAAGNGPKVLNDAGRWLAGSLKRASGAELQILETAGDRPAIVIARTDAWPDIAASAGFNGDLYDAYCIVTRPGRLFVLGNSESAARHGVADLLRRWGFRWFAPSPRWHFVPQLNDVTVGLNIVGAPALLDRRIWYAYGMRGDDLRPLMANYTRWAVANRLSTGSVVQTGHSYGNIIGRNRQEFDGHPEYYALLPDGKRDSERAINARKFCYSNPGLIDLVIRDRLRLLEANRLANPAAMMVSVDPSDGEGTCHCEHCKRLGTTTDRVFHLANHVARGLREKHPGAWVGLYAYSSHRLPPTIEVEPNVYVQVAMGFNRTKYTLPELVEAWSKKVGAIGLREYYGVEAWDWGLPGRMRGARTAYHRKWIPFYAERKLNAINAETNANWGAQTLGLYVASQLMWDPQADGDELVDEFFTLCFPKSAEPMRRLYQRFDEAPALRSATLLPMFRDVQQAWDLAGGNADERQRLADLMSYLVYVAEFRDFSLARARDPRRGDVYYAALQPLMNYAWRIRHRDMVHYYALARRLCNGLPVQDKRMDFYMFSKEGPPVWQRGEPLTDDVVVARFAETIGRLESDNDPTVEFSRYFEPLKAAGDDAGPSGIAHGPRQGVARFRRGLRGYLVPAGKTTVRLGVAPTGRSVTLTVYLRGDTVLFEREFRRSDKYLPRGGSFQQIDPPDFQQVEIELPKANEYRLEITGSLMLHVPPETPFVFEASVARPAWIDYSGPHYFYVPRGTRELIVDAGPRLSLYAPGVEQRIDVTPGSRQAGRDYTVIEIPKDAAGRVWHTSNQTRGSVSLLNVPPLMSFHAGGLFVPREVAEADGITARE